MRHSFNGSYPITRPFGEGPDPVYANYPGSRHPGTDYGLPTNTQLVAGMSGTVTIYDRDPNVHIGRGKEVVITYGSYQRKCCHMNRIDVHNGQIVVEGQPIGLSGFTGYVLDAQGRVGTSEGAHLHDELLIDGRYVSLEEHLSDEQGENDMVDDEGARIILGALGILAQPGNQPDRQPTLDEVKNLIGKPYKQAIEEVTAYQPYKNNLAKIKYYDADVKSNPEAAKKLEEIKKLLEN